MQLLSPSYLGAFIPIFIATACKCGRPTWKTYSPLIYKQKYKHITHACHAVQQALTVVAQLGLVLYLDSEFSFVATISLLLVNLVADSGNLLTEKYTTCPCDCVQWLYRGPALCVTCVSHLHGCRAQGSHLYFNRNSPSVYSARLLCLEIVISAAGRRRGLQFVNYIRHTDVWENNVFNYARKWAVLYYLHLLINKQDVCLYTCIFGEYQKTEKNYLNHDS